MTDHKQQGDRRQASAAPSAKKTFIEPVISQPVDVLEATTFFQTVDSGATGAKGAKGTKGGK